MILWESGKQVKAGVRVEGFEEEVESEVPEGDEEEEREREVLRIA